MYAYTHVDRPQRSNRRLFPMASGPQSLHYAAYLGAVEALHSLLRAPGADPNARGEHYGETPLHLALDGGTRRPRSS